MNSPPPSCLVVARACRASAAVLGLLVLVLVLAAAGACKSPSVANRDGGPRGGSSGPAPERGFGLPDAGMDVPAVDACVPIGCAPVGGRYCGKVGNGCGNELDCGACPAGRSAAALAWRTCAAGRPPRLAPPSSASSRADASAGEWAMAAARRWNVVNARPARPAGPARICFKGGCERLCLQQKRCPAGQDTTVTGTVFAPTPPRFGQADPLYNVRVYVPNAPLDPFRPGVACEKCEDQVSGSPLTTAVSGPDGKFVLRDVPAGTDIPLVLQIGRWRRLVKIPRVEACTSTALPAELTRLPRNRGEGDIPLMAIATGAFDPIECLMRKLGIDDREFTLPTGKGRIHMYRHFGSQLPGGSAPGASLTGDPAALSRYDIVLFPCDSRAEKPPQAMTNLVQYAERGGRLFLTDWSDTWLRQAPSFGPLATWLPTADHLGNEYQAQVERSFPKGQAFAQWLGDVGALAAMAAGMDARCPSTTSTWAGRWPRRCARRPSAGCTPRRPGPASSTSPSTPRSGPRRRSSAGGSSTATSTWCPTRRRLAGVPQLLRRHAHDPAGKGPGVHAVRRRRLRSARCREAPGVRAPAAAPTARRRR